MTTELILQKNSISQNQSNPKSKAAPKEVDYSKYQVGAHVFEPKGHLVNTPVWEAPFVAVQDTFENIKTLGKGLKGEGDDHRLGQLNDLGLQAGGLAIAGYLASTKVLPVKKGMEFVGFASFLASMALFPVLFIQTPIKALYGFNVNQKYVDSYGRKKPFHTDPQYTPWDLYSSEKLNAIGDKMGVDKNIENRQALIKEKMTKIATQSNTMWMLTAGIAVPTMCGLLSSQAEKLLTHINKTIKTAYLDKKMSKLSTIKEPAKKDLKKFQTVLNENQNKPLNEKFVDDLAKMITGSEDVRLKDTFKEDLKELLKSNSVPSVAELFGDTKLEIPYSKGTLSVNLKADEIKAALEAKNLNQNISLFGEKNESQRNSVKNILNTLYKEQASKTIPAFSQERSVREAFDASFETIFNSKTEHAPMVLNKLNREKIEKVYNSLNIFRQKTSILQKYVTHKIGDNESSIAAIEWNKASNKIFDALKLSDKELKQAQESPSSARKILETKFTEIVKDDTRYQETVKKIASAIKTYENAMDMGPVETKDFSETITKLFKKQEPVKGKTFTEVVKNTTKDIYGSLSEELAGIKDGNGQPIFKKTANQISNHFGTSYQADKERKATYKNRMENLEKELKGLNEKLQSKDTPKEEIEKIQKEIAKMTPEYIQKTATEQANEAAAAIVQKSKDANFPGSSAYSIVYDAENKLIGGKSSLNKILHGLDLFKRIESGEAGKALAGKGDAYNTAFKEKIIGYMKYILMEGDIGTHTVKADIPQKEVYKDTMTLLYNVDKNIMHPDFIKLVSDARREEIENDIKNAIKDRRKEELEKASDQKIKKEIEEKIEKEIKETIAKGNEPEGEITKGIEKTITEHKKSLLDSTDLHASTKKALGETNAANFKANLLTLFDQFCNGHYRFKPEHVSCSKEVWGANIFNKITNYYNGLSETTLRKQNRVGESLSNFVQKTASKKYNTRAWLKMTGFAAAGIGAIALISTFFFGKVKQPHTVNKEVEANG